MDQQYFDFKPYPHLHAGGADHLTQPLTTNSPSIYGGADHFPPPLTINSPSIFTTFNNNSQYSYLSFLNSSTTTTTTSSETKNYLHLLNSPAVSPQKMTNAQILEDQKMINNALFLEQQKMMDAHVLEEQKNCMENDEILRNMVMKTRKESSVARKRRHKISEKNRYLKKLLPWVTKMDTATMYDETAKYIKFLQAQISVLSSMPPYDSTPASSNSYSGSVSFSGPNSGSYSSPGSGSFSGLGTGSGSGSYLGLGMGSGLGSGFSSGLGNVGGVELLSKLSRQEVLRVMMNSPRVQTVLSRNGWCLYTVEQMEGMLENMVAVTGEAPGDVLPSYLLDGMLWNYY